MTISYLPEIKVVRHGRAKRLKLTVRSHEIRLTAPSCCSQYEIDQFILKSQQWLYGSWEKAQKNGALKQDLPHYLNLFNKKNPIKIQYLEQAELFNFASDDSNLKINQQQAEQALSAFILAYAKQYLPEYLAQVSHELGFSYQKCQIRWVKTRWGSCSIQHNIMLNALAVLCESDLVRYLCIHELAHTRHFNHSHEFWSEVEQYDSDYKKHRQQLKQFQMPYWCYNRNAN